MPPPTAMPAAPFRRTARPGAVMPSVTTEPAVAVMLTSPAGALVPVPAVVMAPPIETLVPERVRVPPGRDAPTAPTRLTFCSITIVVADVIVRLRPAVHPFATFGGTKQVRNV